ncbi:hypothetical protein PHYSODRAFT_321340 [Phytophthora sojae]|uniref:Transmembrane protein n=1 Tax=Phytophthora sojae (strain P6497) TaxID=1094619 RepID=G4YM13_PHYSP|nr:hypothetical protein PHYSODRAFT_321340 [Phytophthora sojae]EGZ27543.1 hypothetical protein PHYSODRAFT_321340 [Phytophthora sojae]|eukprot:XP_009514818.1 hypothetical protein PHYSODRAFT_321340 [Phytophthora sojae]
MTNVETVMDAVEWCLWHSLSVWKIVWPLWSIAGRLIGALFGFPFNWLTLLKVCVRRYRRIANGPSVQGRPSAERRWKAFESIWATPMVVLEARGEREDGLGWLLYKWLDAYHALWFMFLPNVLELGGVLTVMYWRGSRAECRRSVDRAYCVGRGLRAFITLATYAVFYTVVYVYDLVEKACQGAVGVGVLLLTLNYIHLLKCYETASGGRSPAKMAEENYADWRRSPAKMAEESYADWLRDVEEFQQAGRLSEAFLRADGCVGKPKPVRTLSGPRAEQRALRAKMKAVKEEEAARRGRRVSVRDDVPSGNGGHRRGYGRDRPPAARQPARGLLLEDQLFEDQLTEQSSDFSEGGDVRRQEGGHERCVARGVSLDVSQGGGVKGDDNVFKGGGVPTLKLKRRRESSERSAPCQGDVPVAGRQTPPGVAHLLARV